MGRAPRFVVGTLAAATVVAVQLQDISAQIPTHSGTVRRLVLPGGQTTGVTGDYWQAALANGGAMPQVERLIVVGHDGLVVGEAEGTQHQVVLPDAVFEALSAGALRATLVHNHPRGISLSRADLGLLGKAGVDRVIAVGPDASVFEASVGPAYDHATFESSQYPSALRQVTDRLVEESWRAGVNPARVTPLLSHLIAEVLDRSGIIHYRMTPGAELKRTLNGRHAIVAEVVRAKYRF